MHVQQKEYRSSFVEKQGKAILAGRPVFMGLGIVSGLASLLLVVGSLWIVFAQTQSVNPTTPAHVITPIKQVTPVSPVQPTALPSPPTPISPFPSTFQQAVKTLKEHDRFVIQGNAHLPEVALTFDDGPSPTYTPQILALLHRYDIEATFFCVGSQVQLYPNLVKEEVDQGHLIGNHSWSHPDMTRLSGPSLIWQITTSAETMKRVVGVRPTYFRPPYGAISATTLKYINMFGLTTVVWNTDPTDWRRPGVEAIVQTVMRQAGNGAIILLHDGGGDRSQTVAALPLIISRLRLQGYRFVTIQQLVNDLHAQPAHSNPQLATPSMDRGWLREQQLWYARHAND